jgi:hypothetical protein
MNDEDLSNSDAKTVEEYAKRHDDFLYSLYQLEKRIRALSNKVDTVMQDFPRTQVNFIFYIPSICFFSSQDHLEVRRSELIEQLKDVEDGTRNIAERLNQAQKNQAYFQVIDHLRPKLIFNPLLSIFY